MGTRYVNCSPADLAGPGTKYRATWAATRLGSGLPIFGANVAANIQAIYDGRLTSTGLAYPVSTPNVAPGDESATLDLRIMRAGTSGLTVGQLATALEQVAMSGRDLELTRLERVQEGEGSAAASSARQAATDAGNEAADAGGLEGALRTGASNLKKTLLVALALGAVYLFATRPAPRGDW